MKKNTAKSAPKSAAATPAARAPMTDAPSPRTLAVDIGGTGIKALTLDPVGKPLNDRTRIPTPKHARPKQIVAIVRKLAKAQPGFERVSVGFPGVVKAGIVYTAANLGKGWAGFDLAATLQHKLKKPVRVANDADIQGLGCVTGHGLELVITLGTGFGSVLFAENTRIHLELGHHPFHHGKTYEEELGERALKKMGRKKWLKLLREALNDLQATFNYDRLYIGGGNGRVVNFKLPANVKIISNDDGLLGGIALWRDAGKPTAKSRPVAAKPSLAKTPPKAPAPVATKPPTVASPKAATIAPPKPSTVAPPKPSTVAPPKPSTVAPPKPSTPVAAKPTPAAPPKPVAAKPPTPAAPPKSVAAPAVKPKPAAPVIAGPAPVAPRPAPVASPAAAGPPAASESTSSAGTSPSTAPANSSPQPSATPTK